MRTKTTTVQRIIDTIIPDWKRTYTDRALLEYRTLKNFRNSLKTYVPKKEIKFLKNMPNPCESVPKFNYWMNQNRNRKIRYKSEYTVDFIVFYNDSPN